jgi:hypothetical protein
LNRQALCDIIILDLLLIEKTYIEQTNDGGVYMITKDMNITDIVNKYPQTVNVFKSFGMSCFG